MITADDVRKIAKLSSLKITEDEIAPLAKELSAIFDYAEQIQKLPLAGVAPTSHAVAVNNVFRADEPVTTGIRDTALGSAPQTENAHFLVPKVM